MKTTISEAREMKTNRGMQFRYSPLLLLALTHFNVTGGGAVHAASPAHNLVSVRESASCARATSCASFDFSLTNKGALTVNGLTVQTVSSAMTSFSLNAIASQKCSVAAQQIAFACYPLDVKAGASISGAGVVSIPLPLGSKFEIFTTTNGFVTASGQEVAFSPRTVGTKSPLVFVLFTFGGLCTLALAGFWWLRRRSRRPTG